MLSFSFSGAMSHMELLLATLVMFEGNAFILEL